MCYCVLLLLSACIICSIQGQDVPDLTMLENGNEKICVAGQNTAEYGLAFMSTNLSADVTSTFEYARASGQKIHDSYNCDFNKENICKKHWITNRVKLNVLYNKPISPIIDKRWNDFEIYETNGYYRPTYDNYWYMKKDPFYVSLSVRGSQDAHILLCTTKDPRSSPCYWIIIDGFQDKTLSVIRKCTAGIPDYWAVVEDCKLVRNSINKPENFISEFKWTHFFVSKEMDSFKFWLWDVNMGPRLLLHYIDEDVFPVNYMFFKSYNSIAYWKVNSKPYLNIAYHTKQFPIGPQLNFSTPTSICISLYVIMCSTCSMTLRLESQDSNTVIRKTIQGNNNTSFLTWEKIQLQRENISNSNTSYQLYIKLNKLVETTNTLWRIDNFRTCYSDEITIIKHNSNYNTICQSLKYTNWTISSNNVVQNFSVAEPPRCSNTSYIGRHCNISCKAVYMNTNCEKTKICLATHEDSTVSACTCASGYKWNSNNSNCDIGCSPGNYGYNCNNTCGKCAKSVCHHIFGYCIKGCQKGYIEPNCQETLPFFKYPLRVLIEGITRVVVTIEKSVITGADRLKHSVLLECKEFPRIHWADCTKPIPIFDGPIEINNLKKETFYMIRAIIYTRTGTAYRNEDVPFINITTTCAPTKIYKTNIYSRNGTIKFESKIDSCSVTNYKYQLMQDKKQVESKQVLYDTITLLDLIPYTNYSIIFTSTLGSSFTQKLNFTTNEDAPSAIRNPIIKNISDTEMILSWDEPIERNGIIRRYNLSYELKQRVRCDKIPDSQMQYISVKPNTTTVKINNLQPYSIYQMKIIPETILPGDEVNLTFTTAASENIYEEELSNLVTNSYIKTYNISMVFKSDCLINKGPLYVQILCKCSSNWCNESVNTALVEHSLYQFPGIPFTNYTIELRGKRSFRGKPSSIKKTFNFSLPASNPPAVQDFSAFAKDNNSISLRVLAPYPPHGHLEFYGIQYCSNIICRTRKLEISQLVACNLWKEDYKCYTLNQLYSKHLYTISIIAKNKESMLFSPPTNITAETIESVSSAPLHLKTTWENNECILNWNHPFVPNGRLRKFIITLTLNESRNLSQNETLFYRYEYNITNETRTYALTINSITFSTSYIITVCAVNSFYGKNATLLMTSPPEIPKLVSNIYLDDQVITDAVVTVVVPPLDMKTITTNCLLYVVVNKLNSNVKQNIDTSNPIKKQIYNNIQPNADAWIAKEITEMNNNTIKIFLGSDESFTSSKLNESISNKKLESNTEYEIIVVLINTYKDKISTNKYNLKVTTSRHFFKELYALFLLLLLIPIGVILYRYIKNKLHHVNYVEANVSTNSYLEVLDDTQYEEPIALTDIHTYETIEDPHTYMNVKSNSNNIYANM